MRISKTTYRPHFPSIIRCIGCSNGNACTKKEGWKLFICLETTGQSVWKIRDYRPKPTNSLWTSRVRIYMQKNSEGGKNALVRRGGLRLKMKIKKYMRIMSVWTFADYAVVVSYMFGLIYSSGSSLTLLPTWTLMIAWSFKLILAIRSMVTW